MTNDDLYCEYLTIRKQIEDELGPPQDEHLLNYQTLLQLSYKVAGTRGLTGEELTIQILKLHDAIKKYRIH